jgi:hypothetical protein
MNENLYVFGYIRPRKSISNETELVGFTCFHEPNGDLLSESFDDVSVIIISSKDGL